jgi:exoribonuclease R
MVRRSVRLGGRESSVSLLAARFARVRRDLSLPDDFPPEVLAAASRAAETGPAAEARVDLREVPFVTVDPAGSTDLDQAMHLARSGGPAGGYRVDYAIADVPAYVAPSSPVDVEARRRGQTVYAPDRRTPLHPPVLSEGAASLLEGCDRPAFVWRFELGATGEVESVDLVRALVRSRHRLDYEQVQSACDTHPEDGAPIEEGGLDEVSAQAVLLREVGRHRVALERRRGGASLPLPEQEIDAVDGHYELTLRPQLASEDWNAQLSLMTGMAAARLMLRAGTGILRTLPSPDQRTLDRFRRQARALGVDWSERQPYGELLRSLRREVPRELALMHEAGALFRGAGYTPLTPDGDPPRVTTHAAVAAPYAHVTAPLRRLVDRFALVVCHAVATGAAVPPWALTALGELPAIMSATDQVAGRLERECTDLVEAAVLAHRVGEVFEAVVVDEHRSGAKVQVLDPAVLATARAAGPVALGTRVGVRLESVDVERGGVRFVIEDGERR